MSIVAAPASGARHGEEPPSPWIQRFCGLVAEGGSVLDLACGHGRHARWFAGRGHHVQAVDRSAEALASLSGVAGVETLCADIEGQPWPLPGRTFDAVVVTNYLWRPLMPAIIASLAPDGVLLYETFATGQESIGKPSRPDFLLEPGELLQICAGLRIVAYEDGYGGSPERFVQRIAAVRKDGPVIGNPPIRYRV
jgi:SAM-dependent methyltransferase